MNFFVVFSPDQSKPVVGKAMELDWKSAPFYTFYASLEAAVEGIRDNQTVYPEENPVTEQFWIASGFVSEEDVLICLSTAVLTGGNQTVSFTPTTVNLYSNGCTFVQKVEEDPRDLEGIPSFIPGPGDNYTKGFILAMEEDDANEERRPCLACGMG